MSLQLNGSADCFKLASGGVPSGPPLSIGFWLDGNGSSLWDGVDHVVFTVQDDGLSKYYRVGAWFNGSSNEVYLDAYFGGSQHAGLTPSDSWFTLVRWVAANYSDISTFNPVSGTLARFDHASNAVNLGTVSGLTTMNIGAYTITGNPVAYLAGRLSEFWYADSDLGFGTNYPPQEFVEKLAMEGPFSIHSVADSLIEYRSFRSCGGSDNENGNEVFFGKHGRQVWTTVGSPVIAAPHPPMLSGAYRRPGTRGLILPL